MEKREEKKKGEWIEGKRKELKKQRNGRKKTGTMEGKTE